MGVRTLYSLYRESFKDDTRPAVIYDDGQQKTCKTYREVNFIADSVAEYLQRFDCRHEIIAILMQPGPDVPGYILGILQSDCAFYNMGDDMPPEVLIQLFQQYNITFIIGNDKKHIQLLCEKLSILGPELKSEDGLYLISLTLLPRKKLAQSLAYVITTSGTTGLPKVVSVPHACIVPNVINLREIFKVCHGDLIFQASPMTFDPSIVEMFLSVTSGATLLITSHSVKVDRHKLLDVLCHRNKVTVIQATPTLLHPIASKLLCKVSSLRVLAFGGEACPSGAVIQQWQEEENITQIYNLYGITEVSCWATCYQVKQGDIVLGRSIPLGEALLGTELVVHNKVEERAEEGELLIGGVHRVCGIDSDLTMTPSTFRRSGDLVIRDAEGVLWYQGRKDNQVKRNGKRINPEQIQAVATDCKAISQAAIIFHNRLIYLICVPARLTEDKLGNQTSSDPHLETNKEQLTVSPNRLLNAVATAQDIHLQTSDVAACRGEYECIKDQVKSYMQGHLPGYCLPDRVIIWDGDLPMTKHGKVNRKALVESLEKGEKKAKGSEKNEDMESIVISQCQNLLDVARNDISLEATFVVCGGSSLLAVSLMESLEQTLCHPVPELLETILSKPLASVVRLLEDAQNMPQEVNDNKHGSRGTKRRASDIKSDLSDIKIDSSDIKSDSNDIKSDSIDIKSDSSDINNDSSAPKRRKLEHITDTTNQSSSSFLSISRGAKYFSSDLEAPEKWTKASVKFCEQTGNNIGDEQTGNIKQEWKFHTGKCVDASPLIVKCASICHVFIGSHSYLFCCLDLYTGECIWQTHLGDRVESSAAVSLCSKYVVVGCYDHNIYTLCRHTGKIVWTFGTRGEVKSSPCVDPVTGFVICGSHDWTLYALDVHTQKCVWQQRLSGGAVFSSPCVSTEPHQVYAATLGGALLALNPHNGEIFWCCELGGPLFSSPAILPQGVCIGCVNGRMYTLSHTGQKTWEYETAGAIFSSPTVISNISAPDKQHIAIVFGSQDPKGEEHFLHCLSDDGTLLWKHKMADGVYSTVFGFEWKSDAWKLENRSEDVEKTVEKCENGDGLCLESKDEDAEHSKELKEKVIDSVKSQEKNNSLYITDAGMQSQNAKDSTDGELSKEGTDKVISPKHTEDLMPDTSKKIQQNPSVKDIASRTNAASNICQYVVACTTKGEMEIFEADTGALCQSYTFPFEVFSSPVVVDGRIVVGCRDEYVYCLSL